MDLPPGLHAERQLDFLRDLEQENAWIAPDILPIGLGLWGIHGNIAVDGEVLMAEFATYEDARRVRDQLAGEHVGELRITRDASFGPTS